MSDSLQSDEENRRLTRGLLGTDDAMVWAEEFCRIFKGCTITDVPQDVHGIVDQGTMVGWFANAMGVGESFFRSRRIVTAHRNDDDTIEIVGDLPNEIVISRELLELMIDQHNRSIRGTNVPDDQKDAFMEGFNEGRP